jgi:hypothetical protein
LTTIDSFYQASGSSPPIAGHDAPPPELVEDLAQFLADAIIADIREYPNLAELKAKPESTVESPSGLDRTDPPARRRRTRQEHAAADRHSCAGPSDRRPPPRGLQDCAPKKVEGPSKASEARPLPIKKFES